MAKTDFTNQSLQQRLAWGNSLWQVARTRMFVSRFMGSSSNSVIQRITSLKKVKGASRAVIQLVADLQEDGVGGDASTLEGNEEALRAFEQIIDYDMLRHAVRNTGRLSDMKSTIDFRNEAKDKLGQFYGDRIDQMAFLMLSGISFEFKNNGAARPGGATGTLPKLVFHKITAPTTNRHLRVSGTNIAAGDTSLITAGDTLKYKPLVRAKAFLKDTGRAQYVGVTDTECMEAFHLLARTEGILAALESALVAARRRGAPAEAVAAAESALATVRADGSTGHFPHLIERAKPGLIAVTARGERFTNEANSYHDFMQGLLAATPAGHKPEAWLLCDHAFIRYYGLGAVKPAPMPLTPWLGNGYLKRGDTLAELARACGLDAERLQATVQRYNAMVVEGKDLDFAKGETPYNRIQGDAIHAMARGLPNPCMGPIARGPFYAVKVVMGSLGTFAGLRTNERAQVLDERDQPIHGLYANGNDMSSVMGGHYPAGGITLGPAMTFGFLAAQHAAGQDVSLQP